MRLVLFSSNNCGPCKQVKNYLDKEAVEYTTYTYESNPELIKASKIQAFPTLILYNENNGPISQVIGFNFKHLQAMIKVFKNEH